MTSFPTATQSRAASVAAALRNKLQGELNEVAALINETTSIGHLEMSLLRSLSTQATEFLTGLGYQVVHSTSLHTEAKTTISW
jgi:hypothetical protein